MRVMVRAKEVCYSSHAINRLFKFHVPADCALKRRRDASKSLTMEQREALKSQLSIPGSEWVKHAKKGLPRWFKTERLFDIPRIWAEFWVHNVEPCSNT
ncbi:hypothetical protein A2U01_0071015, partial [Trifolium medium]|nr:hypothetical protein [Trifolium medium]